MYTTFTPPIRTSNIAETTNTDNAQDASNANQQVSTSENVQPTRYQAAFRGRVVVGQEFSLPESGTSVSSYTATTPPSTPSSPLLPPSQPGVRARKKRAPRKRANGPPVSRAPSGPTRSRRKPPQRPRQSKSSSASPPSLTPMARRTS
jgi:hypothetical protein